MSLPEPAQRFIDATNSEDRAGLLAAFAPDAVLDDFGRVFTGLSAIGSWSDAENIGTHNRIAVHRVTGTADATLADISVTGAGYNGPGTFLFHLRGAQIQGLTIRG